MEKAIMYINHPHYLLYWIMCKSKYTNLHDWKEEVDRGQLDGTLRSAVELIEKYGTEDE